MSTNATIAMKTETGMFKQIYVHWDGDTSYTGRILRTYYTDPAKVEQLIELGNLSFIGPEIGVKHDFDYTDHDMCHAYDRDRGEEEQGAEIYDSFQELADEGDQQQYNYFFIDGAWYFCKNSVYEDALTPLTEEVRA